MDFLRIDRNDGDTTAITVTEDGAAMDLSIMDLSGVIEWHGGTMQCTIANGRLAENADTPLSAGVVDLVLSDADSETLSRARLPFLTLRDETPTAEITLIERLAIRVV